MMIVTTWNGNERTATQRLRRSDWLRTVSLERSSGAQGSEAGKLNKGEAESQPTTSTGMRRYRKVRIPVSSRMVLTRLGQKKNTIRNSVMISTPLHETRRSR